MSIGVVVADADTFLPLQKQYYIIFPEFLSGGMYASALKLTTFDKTIYCSRHMAISNIESILYENNISSIFAYNASFDKKQLPELNTFNWHDILHVAAYRQFNNKISIDMNCCKTGRLKTGFSAEAIYRLLSNDLSYTETHNALLDALDELKIMKLLGKNLNIYKKI